MTEAGRLLLAPSLPPEINHVVLAGTLSAEPQVACSPRFLPSAQWAAFTVCLAALSFMPSSLGRMQLGFGDLDGRGRGGGGGVSSGFYDRKEGDVGRYCREGGELATCGMFSSTYSPARMGRFVVRVSSSFPAGVSEPVDAVTV